MSNPVNGANSHRPAPAAAGSQKDLEKLQEEFRKLQENLGDLRAPAERAKLVAWANIPGSEPPTIVEQLAWLSEQKGDNRAVVRFLGKEIFDILEKDVDQKSVRDRIVTYLGPKNAKTQAGVHLQNGLRGQEPPQGAGESLSPNIKQGRKVSESSESLSSAPDSKQFTFDREAATSATSTFDSSLPAASDRSESETPNSNSHSSLISIDAEDEPPSLIAARKDEPVVGWLQKLRNKLTRPSLVEVDNQKDSPSTTPPDTPAPPSALNAAQPPGGLPTRMEIAKNGMKAAFSRITYAGSMSSVLDDLERGGHMHTRSEIAFELLPHIIRESSGPSAPSRNELLTAALNWLGGSRMSAPVLQACIRVAAESTDPAAAGALVKALGSSLTPAPEQVQTARTALARLQTAPSLQEALLTSFNAGVSASQRHGGLSDNPVHEAELDLALAAFKMAVDTEEGPEQLERRLAVMEELPGRGEAQAVHERAQLNALKAVVTVADFLTNNDGKSDALGSDKPQLDHKHSKRPDPDPTPKGAAAATEMRVSNTGLPLDMQPHAYGKQMAADKSDADVAKILSDEGRQQPAEWITQFLSGWIDGRKKNNNFLSRDSAEKIALAVVNSNPPDPLNKLIEQVVSHVPPKVRPLVFATINQALSPAPRF